VPLLDAPGHEAAPCALDQNENSRQSNFLLIHSRPHQRPAGLVVSSSCQPPHRDDPICQEGELRRELRGPPFVAAALSVAKAGESKHVYVLPPARRPCFIRRRKEVRCVDRMRWFGLDWAVLRLAGCSLFRAEREAG